MLLSFSPANPEKYREIVPSDLQKKSLHVFSNLHGSQEIHTNGLERNLYFGTCISIIPATNTRAVMNHQMNKMNKRLLLFDIDGTLVSVEREASRQLLRDVVQETMNIRLPQDFVFSLGGKTDFQIMNELAELFAVPQTLVEQRRELIKERLTAHTERLSSVERIERLHGVEELLAALSKREDATLGVLTGNIKTTAYLKLRPYNLDALFPFGAFGCDHVHRTMLPPIAINRANEHLATEAFTPENTVIIGDTLNDIACARAHGIRVVAVATGAVSYERLAEAEPDALVRDFADTAHIIDLLMNQS